MLKWILRKVRDDEWHGFWFRWHCPHCDWLTSSRPVGFNYCPSCGRPVDGIMSEEEYDNAN